MIELTQSQCRVLGAYIMACQKRAKGYTAALELAARIDVHLARETFHFHHTNGRLLTKFDEVIGAIMAGELAEAEVPPVTEDEAMDVCGIGYAYCRMDNRPREYITLPRWMVERRK